MSDPFLTNSTFGLDDSLLPLGTAVVPPQTQVVETADRILSVFGVRITDVSFPRAVALLEQMLARRDGQTRTVYFANAHTLNCVATAPEYRRVLNAASYVFGDGTGVRWASKLQGRPVLANLNGTDLTPALLRATARRGYRYYFLGSRPEIVAAAAAHVDANYPGWIRAGVHHGFLDGDAADAAVIGEINAARPHLLLVGMGNPRQEQWLHRYRQQLHVPLCMATGGLFAFLAHAVSRAPGWMRRLGVEWLWVMYQQPHKAWRYLAGNPLFLARLCRERFARGRELPAV
jgi:N-acetylglucosaminyldiphosphoundecaprenol N-acetyl-beta-D-mannosaminyltransferase